MKNRKHLSYDDKIDWVYTGTMFGIYVGIICFFVWIVSLII